MLGKVRDSLEKSLFDYCKESGFIRPTPFQTTIIPHILQGRDISADISQAYGKTASVLLALALQFKEHNDTHMALIVVDSEASLKKLTGEMKRVFQHNRYGLTWAIAGMESNVKKEIRQISKTVNVLAGTSVRIIDHIRRENLQVSDTDVFVIMKDALPLEQEPSNSGFDKDILFIHSKLNKKPQIILYKRGAETPDELSDLMQRPILLTAEDWLKSNIQYLYYQILDPRQKQNTLTRVIGDLDLHKAVIIAKPGPNPPAIEKTLNSFGYTCIQAGGQSRNFSKSAVDFCAASYKTNLEKEIDFASSLLYYDILEDRDFYLKSLSLLNESDGNPYIVFIGTKEELETAEKMSEANRMTVKKDENPTEKEAMEGAIKKIVAAVREDSDPEELNYLKGLIKKNVPLTLRGYFAAYLLKHQSGGKSDKPSHLQTLFVSIGKNRSIFPKDLAKLFAATLDISHTELGAIKILDNYSFVEISATLAQKAIDALDGADFKGRKITVNFARKKEEKA